MKVVSKVHSEICFGKEFCGLFVEGIQHSISKWLALARGLTVPKIPLDHIHHISPCKLNYLNQRYLFTRIKSTAFGYVYGCLPSPEFFSTLLLILHFMYSSNRQFSLILQDIRGHGIYVQYYQAVAIALHSLCRDRP